MTNHFKTSELCEIFNDNSFHTIFREFMLRCFTWEEYLSFTLPTGLSPIAMWDILRKIGQCVSLEIPIPDLNNQQYWYRRTYELEDTIREVINACEPGSFLYRAMNAGSRQRFLMNVRIAEINAATRLDGISISERVTGDIIRQNRKPQNAAEQMIMNSFQATEQLPELINEPFSTDMFWHFHHLLTKDVDMDALDISSRIPLGTGLFEWEDNLIEEYAVRQIEYIAAYANQETGSKYDYHILRALFLPDAFRFYRPFKKVSYQIGRLASCLYALKLNLPVLNLLPSSLVKLEWDEGRILPPFVSFDRPSFETLRRRMPGDLTSMQTLVAQLTLIALRIVEHYVRVWENWDCELIKALKKDINLNERQRSILGKALRKPESEFTIRYHKNANNITYPTARSDFLELEEKGYLIRKQQGKTFIFVPSENLRNMFVNPDMLVQLEDFSLSSSFFENLDPYNK